MRDNIIISLSSEDSTFTAELSKDSTGTDLIKAFCALMRGVTYSSVVIKNALEEVYEEYSEEYEEYLEKYEHIKPAQ